jgi:hypothetical protein
MEVHSSNLHFIYCNLPTTVTLTTDLLRNIVHNLFNLRLRFVVLLSCCLAVSSILCHHGVLHCVQHSSSVLALLYHTFLCSHRVYNEDGHLGVNGVSFQNGRVRFFCPLPLASLRCVMSDADSDDSAPPANWAMTALSTAWRRTFSGILSQYSSSFLPRTLSIAIDLTSSRGVRPIASSPCTCVFGRASK